MKKHKMITGIPYLPDEQYDKALFHLRSQINDLLMEHFNQYGLGDAIPGATASIVKGAEDFALVCRGIDKPIVIPKRIR